MTTTDQLDPRAVAATFDDVKADLRGFIASAHPTDKNLHLAALRKLDEGSFEELARLAKKGRNLVDQHRGIFLKRGLYEDGMFWYELFLAISSAALSYEGAADAPLPKAPVERLVETLVAMSEYSTAVTGDITKRNREALGNLLLRAEKDELIERARSVAGSIESEAVLRFVQDTIELVERTQTAKKSGPRREQAKEGK